MASAVTSTSSLPAGNTNDNLLPELERIGRLTAGTESADLLLVRLPRADGVRVWKLASPTVAAIPKLYQHLAFLQHIAFFAWDRVNGFSRQ